MSNFEINGNKYYRLSKDCNKVINNNVITDELALEFLRSAPTRIRLFSKYPENWEAMIEGEEPVEKITIVPVVEEIEPAPLKREALRKYKMSELREMYPNIKEEFGGKKEDLITSILNSGQ